MNHFALLVYAELRKVYTRGSGLAALIIAVLVALVALGAMLGVQRLKGDVQVNNSMVENMVQFSAISVSGWALYLRNFFVLPLFLLLSTGAAVAGELSDRTLRETLLRPVSRVSVLAAKTVALSVLSATTLGITYLLSFGGGLLLFGLPDATTAAANEPGPLALGLGFAASFLSDLGLIGIGMLVALFLRSVGGVVVGVVLLLMADLATRAILNLLGGILQQEWASQLIPWTLGHALGFWEGWGGEWELASFGAALAVIGVSLSAAALRFQRMDVP